MGSIGRTGRPSQATHGGKLAAASTRSRLRFGTLKRYWPGFVAPRRSWHANSSQSTFGYSTNAESRRCASRTPAFFNCSGTTPSLALRPSSPITLLLRPGLLQLPCIPRFGAAPRVRSSGVMPFRRSAAASAGSGPVDSTRQETHELFEGLCNRHSYEYVVSNFCCSSKVCAITRISASSITSKSR